MNEIEKLLPHREPFLFVDEIVEAGEKKLSPNIFLPKKNFSFRGISPNTRLCLG